MRVTLLGGAGFIGTNLVIRLSGKGYDIRLVDTEEEYFRHIKDMGLRNVQLSRASFDEHADFDDMVRETDVVYHLISTTAPTTSNQQIPEELTSNVVMSASLLEACVRQKVKRVVFLSSGGTVYGKEDRCPLKEEMPTNPISSYGIQKIAIEKLLYLYHYLYGLDYRVIRLSNPYGPYQRPNGILGAVTTFTYKALKNEDIVIYGDGSVIRDFLYIDDAVNGILNIAEGEGQYKIYNLGSGKGISIRQIVDVIGEALGVGLSVKYTPKRKADVPVNILDITRYESEYGALHPMSLKEGILRTADFLKGRMV